MEVEESRPRDGLKNYYIAKIEELQSVVGEKSQDVRRLEAQRNELNAKGQLLVLVFFGNIYLTSYLNLIMRGLFPSFTRIYSVIFKFNIDTVIPRFTVLFGGKQKCTVYRGTR